MLKTLEEAEQALQQFVPPADAQKAKYTLDRITAFMDSIGNPQEKIKVIHVAGTSGKTSTCYFLAALLEQAGLKVGLTVSPHITKISERVQVNGRPIADEDFAKSLDSFIELARATRLELTYFELLMAFAYWYFAKSGVDVAVIETGLGGLLDGSNVVSNPAKTCVITDIGIDHTNVLGTSLEQIAEQKSGIIKTGNQAFMFEQGRLIDEIFANRAKKVSATLNMLSERTSSQILPLFQQRNFNLAEQVVQSWLELNNLPRLSSEQIKRAAETNVPGRMEVVKYQGRTFVLDGAHNAQKMQAFVSSFKAKYPNQKAVVLLGVKDGKDYGELAEELLPITERVIITNFKLSQDLPVKSVDPNAIAKAFDDRGFSNYEIIEDQSRALENLIVLNSSIGVITGSLYLVSAIRSKLGVF
jgi:dihydrofolate synthase / folylpolyglutamate synthase